MPNESGMEYGGHFDSEDVPPVGAALHSALHEIHEFVSREHRVAMEQAPAATVTKDYRAADRHRSFAIAMQKVRSKVRDIARRNLIQLDSYNDEPNDKATHTD